MAVAVGAGVAAVCVIGVIVGVLLATNKPSSSSASSQTSVTAAHHGASGSTGNSYTDTSGVTGGTDQSPETTAPAPASTTSLPADAGQAIAALSLSTDGQQAMAIVQSYASALARHDWDTARSLKPSLTRDDASLQQGYGSLEQSTVVVDAEDDSGPGTALTGAYVAWEYDRSGNRRTSIYFVRWTVDLPSGTITQERSTCQPQVGVSSSWVDPQTEIGTVTSLCGE